MLGSLLIKHLRCARIDPRETARANRAAANLPGTTLLGSHSLHAVDAPLSKQKMATSAELYASAQILGTECADANMAFLKCKAEAQHPRHCLEAGTAVTSCGDGLIARLKSTSGAEFEAFRACLADTNNAFDKCRAQKEALHAAFSAAR